MMAASPLGQLRFGIVVLSPNYPFRLAAQPAIKTLVLFGLSSSRVKLL